MRSGTGWRKSGWGSVALGAVGAVALLGGFGAWAWIDPASLHVTCREDGPVEDATAIAFLAATIGFAIAMRSPRLPELGRRGMRLLLFLGMLLMIVFCGEEVSWGQRIFGFATPEPLREINQQREFNLHNIGELQHLKYSALVAFVAFVGILVPAIRCVPLLRRPVARLGIPAPPAAWVPLFVATLICLRNVANWLHLHERNDPQEFGELLLGIAMAGFALHAAARPHDVALDAPAAAADSGSAPPPAAPRAPARMPRREPQPTDAPRE